MKYTLNLIFGWMLLVTATSAAQSTQSIKDSLRNVITASEGAEKLDAYIRLSNFYYAEMHDEQKRDTLFTLYDEIDVESERQGNDRQRCVIRVNKLQVLFAVNNYDEIFRLAPEYLGFVEKKQVWRFYYMLYNPLISSYRQKGDNDKALDIARGMYEHAKTRQNNTGMGLALFYMSHIYLQQHRLTEQEKCLRETIVLIKDSTNVYNILADVYRGLGICLIAQQRYDEAIQITDESEPVIRRYEEMANSPQPNAWRKQYLSYVDAYRQSGRYDLAEIYCNKIDSISGGTYPLFEERAGIYLGRKQYPKALEMVEKALDRASPYDIPHTLALKMMILLGKGDFEASQQTFRDYVAKVDTLHNEKMNAQLDEIRTIYEVDKINAEKERIRYYFLFALGGCLLLAILLGLYIYYSRQIKNKNRSLFHQIKEQDTLVESLKQMAQNYESLAQSVSPEDQSVASDIAKELRGDYQQRKLVTLLNEYLLNEKRFTNSEINYDDIISALATNRSYFYKSIKTVTDKTPTEYVRDMQLEEAKRMLEYCFDLNVDAIVEECGFASRSTFYRLFRERYQISPADYRKIAKEKA